MDSLGVAWLPGLVFLALAVWLVRKVIEAARTERDLEDDRLAAAGSAEPAATRLGAQAPPIAAATPAPESEREQRDRPRRLAAVAAPAGPHLQPTSERDLSTCTPEHLALIGALVAERARAGAGPIEVVWARSVGEHAAWCERRGPAQAGSQDGFREVLCVAQVLGGKVVDRWTHGG